MVLDYEVTDRTDHEAAVLLRGELSGGFALALLRRDLERHFIDDGIRRLRIDVSSVHRIDLEGIGVLVSLWRQARDRGKLLVVEGAAGQVREKLAITGLLHLLERTGTT